MKKKKKTVTVNIHAKYCTVRISQGWPNFFTCFHPFLISQLSHDGKICLILGGECSFKPRLSKDGTFNLGSPLETKGFTPTAIFKFATNISRTVRIARNTGVAITRACSRSSAAETDPMFHVEWFLTNMISPGAGLDWLLLTIKP